MAGQNWDTQADWDAATKDGIQVDGSTFTLASAMPDSVVTQFDAGTFTTGDTTWTDDVRSNDMALTGDLQAVSLSNGNSGVEGDGTDDHGLNSMPSELSGASLNSFAIEFSIETTETSDSAHYFGNREGSGQSVEILTNINENFNTDDGNFLVVIDDDSGVSLRFAPSSSPNINNGSRHTILINVIDAANNSVEVWIDGNSVSLSYAAQNGPSSWIDWTQDTGWFARQNNGTVERYASVAFGKIRFHKTSVSGPTL